MNLGRHWKGYFVYQRDETDEYPIEATLEVKSGRLTGSMIDSRLEETHTPEQMLKIIPAGTPLYEEWLRAGEAYPDMVVTYRSPRDSRLRGSLRRHKVKFVKTYTERLLRITSLNDCEPTVDELPTFPVSYVGELDPTGREIVGTWTYPRPVRVQNECDRGGPLPARLPGRELTPNSAILNIATPGGGGRTGGLTC